MAHLDANITELTAATSLLDTDLLYLGRDPFGLTDDRKITGLNLKTSLINTNNLQISAGLINTIQDIAITSSPIFNALDLLVADDATSILSFSDATHASAGSLQYDHSNERLLFFTGGASPTEKMRMDTLGVAIGVDLFLPNLIVPPTATASSLISLIGFDTSSGVVFKSNNIFAYTKKTDSPTQPGAFFRLGIQTVSPLAQFQMLRSAIFGSPGGVVGTDDWDADGQVLITNNLIVGLTTVASPNAPNPLNTGNILGNSIIGSGIANDGSSIAPTDGLLVEGDIKGNSKLGLGVAPTEVLQLNAGNILGEGTFGAGDIISVSGEGTRLMWYPRKGSFRAGTIDGTQWDDANIGNNSVAMGNNSRATGSRSFAAGSGTLASNASTVAMGDTATASGSSSVAMGRTSNANGNFSVAMGDATLASGASSVAMGLSTQASQSNTVAMGIDCRATASGAVAMGNDTRANGTNSFSIGSEATAGGANSFAMGNDTSSSGIASVALNRSTTASGENATALGISSTAQAYVSIVGGRFNTLVGTTTSWVNTDPLLVLGNGTSGGARADAFTVFKDGKATLQTSMLIGGTTPTASTILDLQSTTGALGLSSMTTTERDNLTATDRMILYNETTQKFQGRAAGAWVDLH